MQFDGISESDSGVLSVGSNSYFAMPVSGSANGSASDSARASTFDDDLMSHDTNDTRIIVKPSPDRNQNVIHIIPHFSFIPEALALRRNVNRRVDLEEMANVNYVCAGSNSHIFSATWRNQNVIIKVSIRACRFHAYLLYIL